jgi:hypothetical protein
MYIDMVGFVPLSFALHDEQLLEEARLVSNQVRFQLLVVQTLIRYFQCANFFVTSRCHYFDQHRFLCAETLQIIRV